MQTHFRIRRFPNRWKISLLVWLLFAAGVSAFVFLENSHINGFWVLWFCFIGSVVLVVSISRDTIVRSDRLYSCYYLFGFIPIFLAQPVFSNLPIERVVRRTTKASGYEEGSKGIYRHQILLISASGERWLLQDLGDDMEKDSSSVIHASEEFGSQFRVGISHEIESWDT